MRLIIATALAVGWLAASCAGQHRRTHTETATSENTPDAVNTVAQGTVRAVGADPFAQIVVAQATEVGTRDVAILGRLRGELAALQGAEVRVRGRALANPQGLPPRAIDVVSYQVVAINGAAPEVGQLVERDGVLWLNDKRLVGAPEELKRAVGAKVWVVGRSQGGQLEVQLYGIIAHAVR